MINFLNNSSEKPFEILKDKYNEALLKDQSSIEAMSISSFDACTNEVNSRFVNIKYVESNNLIFFTNYSSPKSIEFASHNQIAALFYWEKINTQIRMKGNIIKTSYEFNQKHFLSRSEEKNALAISSHQSSVVDSFDEVVRKFEEAKEKDDLYSCPEYWGGYSFTPYEIEFWEGNKNRFNKRNLYKFINSSWEHFILEP